MKYPNEDEPDGDRFLPHHYLHGAWVLTLLALVAEANTVLVAIAVSLFGWYHVWYHYHVFGASLTLAGLCAAVSFSLVTSAFSPIQHALAIFAFLWALDDVVEHATGIWTPLDWLWNNRLRQYVVSLD